MHDTVIVPDRKDTYYFHRVRPGDSLSRIIHDYYGVNWTEMQPHIQTALKDNPEISDPDRIQPGQLVMLRQSLTDVFGEPLNVDNGAYVKAMWEKADPRLREALVQVSPWYTALSAAASGAGTGLFTLEKTLSANRHLLKGIPDKYKQYKKGLITKGQYDYYRRMQLKRYAQNIGPVIEKVVYGKRTPNEVIRIDRGQPLAASTQSIQTHLGRLKGMARAASTGNILLAGAGVGLSCLQIGAADSQLEKNVIAVETIGGTLFGAAAGLAVSVLLLSGPAGWFTILAIGTLIALGSAITGYGLGRLYRSVDALNSFDLVNRTGIEGICG